MRQGCSEICAVAYAVLGFLKSVAIIPRGERVRERQGGARRPILRRVREGWGNRRICFGREWWPETGLNRRRRPFQGRALPLSYLASVQNRLHRPEGNPPNRSQAGRSTNRSLQQLGQYTKFGRARPNRVGEGVISLPNHLRRGCERMEHPLTSCSATLGGNPKQIDGILSTGTN